LGPSAPTPIAPPPPPPAAAPRLSNPNFFVDCDADTMWPSIRVQLASGGPLASATVVFGVGGVFRTGQIAMTPANQSDLDGFTSFARPENSNAVWAVIEVRNAGGQSAQAQATAVCP
jgi:hypothetical protein